MRPCICGEVDLDAGGLTPPRCVRMAVIAGDVHTEVRCGTANTIDGFYDGTFAASLPAPGHRGVVAMTKTPEELAKLTEEELAAELARVGDGVQDATAVIQELVRRVSPPRRVEARRGWSPIRQR